MAKILWRINPDKCDYKKLDAVDTFSSKCKINVQEKDVLIVVQSGRGRGRGILGLWEVRETYYGPLRKGQCCWIGAEAKERKEPQFRVVAGVTRHCDVYNGHQVQTILGARKAIVKPFVLKAEEADQLLAMT